MNREELEHVSRALVTATATVAERLEHAAEVTKDPTDVMAMIDDDTEASIIGNEWVKEAEDELARRQQIVEQELSNRAKRRG